MASHISAAQKVNRPLAKDNRQYAIDKRQFFVGAVAWQHPCPFCRDAQLCVSTKWDLFMHKLAKDNMQKNEILRRAVACNSHTHFCTCANWERQKTIWCRFELILILKLIHGCCMQQPYDS